ncbi:DHA2 family efflux MFS transporter permease subunit [Paenibacillus senegalensis]|uniref:DHA2 family efflux MFS transporter permease subunit n=1 Tax=Paenibacillus senegalensis TaxID=1465766 RepID=UPI0002881A7A|nr:DHA2 family efflux MFS transporter permease subunit [Paenibacillus senegalensis]
MNNDATTNNTNTETKKGIVVFILILGTFLAALNQTVMSVATPALMNDLAISPATAQWLTTGYMLVNGVLIPISAFLMKRFTTRQLFQGSMILFLAGTVVAAVAASFPVLLAGRVIQAAGAGIIMPLLFNVVLKLYPPAKRGTIMGMVSFAILFAPAVGPTLAGYVLDLFPWQVMFYGLIPLVVIVIISGHFYLKNVSETSKAKVDMVSASLSTIGFAGLLYGFSAAGNSGWSSPEVILSLLVGVIGLGLFTRRQLVSADPFLDLRTFKYGTFALNNIINVGITIIMYADMILLPLYLQNSRGYTAMESGLMMLPGAVLMGLLSPVAGKLFDRYGAKWITVIGLVITIATTVPFAVLTESTSYTFLLIMSTGRRIGMALLITPIQTAGLNQIPTSLSAHGSAIWNTIRQVAGAVGTSLLVTVMANSSDKHLDSLITSGEAAGQTEQALLTAASIHGVNEAYFVIIIVGLISLLLSFFIKNRSREEKVKKKLNYA